MKISELEERALEELGIEKEEMAVETIKERIKEIEYAERVLAKMKRQYSELLDKDLDEVFYESED